jgi:6-phosphofructokinase 1
MKRIAVLTSGGDAPGMNAAIRAVVRTGVSHGWEVFGVHRGYQGLIDDDLQSMSGRDVSGIIQKGGTVLQTARSERFRTDEGRLLALHNLNARGIDALVVIGGNGSQSGSLALWQMGYPVVGIASTIDNDLPMTDTCIGVDTALNTALDAIDRIKDTATSHSRAFLIEVMGRKSGYLALMSALAGGAEMAVIPEVDLEPEAVAKELRDAYIRGKGHAIVVVAEGAKYNAEALAQHFKSDKSTTGFEPRVTILGHIQRGGSPSAFDRILATRLGYAAVEQLAAGHFGVLVGLIKGTVQAVPLEEVFKNSKPLDMGLFHLGEVLAR